jgi:hypothetical protein
VGQALAVCRVVEGDYELAQAVGRGIHGPPRPNCRACVEGVAGGVVVAASPDTGVAANTVLARLTESFGGRGGGKADLAQGGGLTADPEAVVESARSVIARKLASPSSSIYRSVSPSTSNFITVVFDHRIVTGSTVSEPHLHAVRMNFRRDHSEVYLSRRGIVIAGSWRFPHTPLARTHWSDMLKFREELTA